ncbi:unnamed protein product [Miscanthus lutarioriparius]|uniref:Uncharacterized protein n=1 Tax=Miscanthus lutarioriparius TaxID=422564 RepID=A0A811NKT9_9POAL|nr:unnamed protein product [Miscanthus lutarioriparius]
MLQPQLLRPPRLSLADPVSTDINCSRGGGRRRPKPKTKTIAFPPIRRLVSTSLRRLLPRPRPLIVLPGGGGGGWFRLGKRRKTSAEEVAAVALALVLGGHRLAALAEAWNVSGLGQVLDVWARVLGRGRSRRGDGLRRLAAFLLGVVVCALVCHTRGAAFLEVFQKTGGGRKLMRIFLH